MELNLSDVLSRVGKLSGVSTDAEIARVLGVSPQTLSTWKRRGTIPYERVCDYAVNNDVSLDYLLLGLGGSSYVGGVDPILLEGIGLEFLSTAPELHSAYNLALVYNKITPFVEPGKNWGSLVRREVAYLAQIVKMQRNQPDLSHEEEQRIMKKLGISEDEVSDKAANIKDTSDTNQTKVKQTISGSNHQIAGRDLVNKDKS